MDFLASMNSTDCREALIERPARILLADADRSLLAGYSASLEAAGHKVDGAGDGLECLARLRAGKPELLILNPDLPWGSGTGVLACMNDDPSLRTRVMILADEVRPELLIGGLSRFIHGYFLKPLSASLLPQCVQRVLSPRATLLWVDPLASRRSSAQLLEPASVR